MTEAETLTTLIRDMKGRRSYPELARESGPGLGRSRWQQLGDPTFELSAVPKREAIEIISRVLRVPERRVWLAIGREMGVDVDAEESPLLSRMVTRTSALSPKQVDMILELVGELVDLQLSLAEAKGAQAPVRHLKAARKATGAESRGARGSAKPKA